MASTNISKSSDLKNVVRNALKQWNDDNEEQSPLEKLFLFRKLLAANSFDKSQAKRQVLQQAIEDIRLSYPAEAELLESRFCELTPVHQLANHFSVAESTFYVMQRKAVNRFTEYLLKLDNEAQAMHKVMLNRRLESPSYVRLIGVQRYLASLSGILTNSAPPWIISIEGIGGIGKTSLAHATVAYVIESEKIDEVSWISARQLQFNLGGAIIPVNKPALTADALIERLVTQLLPDLNHEITLAQKLLALQTRLKAIPHVIVIDNLETVEDITALFPLLQTLANPTKFVLTSRTCLFGEPNIFHLSVPELDERDSIRLIRQEAQVSNLSALLAASDEELRPIIETVGGNPLALRLVVGQLHVHSLLSILQQLQFARGESVENLYTYIYRHAWDQLDIYSKRALLVMPLANPEGDDLSYLSEVSDLEEHDLRHALDHLVKLNLVDVRGSLNDRRYSIHGLTRTFLQEQVSLWE